MRFAPRWGWTVLTAAAVVAFVSLGSWQFGRGERREAQWRDFESLGPAVPADALSIPGLPHYAHVTVQGRWNPAQQFLLDNISHDGAPGFEVLTALKLANGESLLVNRGWLPFSGYRDRLPDIGMADITPGGEGGTTISGRLGDLPVPGLARGRQPPAMEGPWPRLTSFPAHEELEQALHTKLLSPVLLLDADSGAGYLRQWRPPGIPPERHFGYAFQWWMFAAIAFGLYVSLNLKRGS